MVTDKCFAECKRKNSEYKKNSALGNVFGVTICKNISYKRRDECKKNAL